VGDFVSCLPKTARKLPEQVRRALVSSDDPDRVLDEYISTLSIQKKETAFQAVRLAEAADKAQSHPDGLYHGIMSLMVKDSRGKAGYFNVEALQRFYQGRFHSKLADMLEKFRTKRLGFLQDDANIAKFIRAVYGETTDDAAINQFAKTWI
jgi:hypothetical protein